MKGIVVAMVVLLWSAAVDADERSAPAACPADAPQTCERAKLALVQADVAVKDAAQARALWTTAVEALRDARTLFAAGEYERAQQAAQVATDQAKLGVAQTRYPMLPMPQP